MRLLLESCSISHLVLSVSRNLSNYNQLADEEPLIIQSALIELKIEHNLNIFCKIKDLYGQV